MKDSRATQRGRILELLIAARGEWVPLPKIAACAAQYNARIFELRRLGFRIQNRTSDTERTTGCPRHSWYRLCAGISHTSPPKVETDNNALSVGETPSLFGHRGQEIWHDPEEGCR